MLKTLIAGVAAVGLMTAAAPNKAAAGDGGEFVTGVIAGVFLLGTLAAIDNAYDDRRRYRHDHGHVRVKPKYGHHSHNVYRHGTRIYSDRDNRYRHDNYGYRDRDYRGSRHSDRRYDDDRGHYHKKGQGHVKVRDNHDADFRHKGGKGGKFVDRRVHDKGALRNDRPRQRDAKRIRAERKRLAAKDARLQAQIDRRVAYARRLNPGWDQ